ncbi:hypothetical protein D3C76_1166670 [compost metagenome]
MTVHRIGWDHEMIFAAVGFCHGHVQLGVTANNRHIVQGERTGGDQRGIDHPARLADFNARLGRAGNT